MHKPWGRRIAEEKGKQVYEEAYKEVYKEVYEEVYNVPEEEREEGARGEERVRRGGEGEAEEVGE